MTDALGEARDRVRRLDQLGRLRTALARQVDGVERELGELRGRLAAEERDASKLERVTLTSIVATILGTKDKRLARERAEADLARLRLTEGETRHRYLSSELARVDDERHALAGAPRDFELAMAEAERKLQAAGDPRGDQLIAVAVSLANVAADAREHDEACRAGSAALDRLRRVLDHLGGARNWSTVDMFSGGFADWFEHDRLESARSAAVEAQRALDAFGRELADVGVKLDGPLTMPMADGASFVDWFFDNIVVDALRHQRIQRTGQQTFELASWVHAKVDHLGRRHAELTAEWSRLAAERERLHGLR